MRRLAAWLERNVAAFEGSTRPVSLIRIGIPLLCWAEFGERMLLFRDLRPDVTPVIVSLFASTLLLFVGYRSRLAALWAAASQTAVYLWLGGRLGFDYTHHHTFLLLVATWILALTPCGGSYSLDRWLAVERARRAGLPPPPERGPLWAQRLLALHVSTVYFWAAYDKLSLAFLSGARMEHFYMFFYGGSDYPHLPGFHALMVAVAWATVALELFLSVALWLPRLRGVAILLGIGFHLLLYYLLPVQTFSMATMLLYLAYMDPDRVHRVIDAVSGVPAR